MISSPLGRRERGLILTHAVVEQSRDPLSFDQDVSLAAVQHLIGCGLDEFASLGFVALPNGEQYGREGREGVSSRFSHGFQLLAQRGGLGQLAEELMHVAALAQRERKHGQCAGVQGELDKPDGEELQVS